MIGRSLYRWERVLLESCDLYLVGGAVRDLLLGRADDQVDRDYVARGIGLEELERILRDFGSTTFAGRSFGVLKFRTPEGPVVDIALPRKEYSTGPGHKEFEVEYDPSIPVEEDLMRRDFTMNSMAIDLRTGRLVDPLDGRGDLEKGTLRVNRDISFSEDPLRILRGVQFMARFGLLVDERTGDLMEEHAGGISTVSPERTREELNKLMTLSERPGDGYVFMHHRGILGIVLPELERTWGVEQNEYHPDDVFHHSVKSCDMAGKDLLVRWCALLHDLGKEPSRMEKDGRTVFYGHETESAAIAKEVLERLVFPSDFIERAVRIISAHMFMITGEWSDAAVRRLLSRVGKENIEPLLELRRADGASRIGDEIEEEVEYSRERIEKVLREEAALSRADLVIGGGEIMDLTGLAQGPRIGEIIDHLFERVIEEPRLNNREDLERIVLELERGRSEEGK